MKNLIKLSFLITITCALFFSCGKSDDGDDNSNNDGSAITALVDGKTVNTTEFSSFATLVSGSGFTLVDIEGLNDDISRQFQIKISSTNETNLEGTYAVTVDEILTVGLNYIEYTIPEDSSSIEIWKSISGEIIVSEDTDTRFKGSFDVIVEHSTMGQKTITGSYDVKKNPFSN